MSCAAKKIDLIPWSGDQSVFVSNALSPAKVLSVTLNEAEKSALVICPDAQLSLAIGKEGQNAWLAAKLTGWRIDIKNESQAVRVGPRGSHTPCRARGRGGAPTKSSGSKTRRPRRPSASRKLPPGRSRRIRR